MKNINETFTDEEYTEMISIKKAASKNWHDFILDLARKENLKFQTATVGKNGMASIGRPLADQQIEWRIQYLRH